MDEKIANDISLCGHGCFFVIGGPFISENPDCPVHGEPGQGIHHLQEEMETHSEAFVDIAGCRYSCRKEVADEMQKLRDLLARAYQHHTSTSLPTMIERFGSPKAAALEGENLWLREIPAILKIKRTR